MIINKLTIGIKQFIPLVVGCCFTLSALAQQGEVVDDENPVRYVYMGNLEYTSPKVTVASLLTGALQKKVSTQNENYMPALREALLKGVSNARRLVIKEETPEEPMETFIAHADGKCFLLEGTVSSLETGTVLPDKLKDANKASYYGRAVFDIHLKDLQTNEIFLSHHFERESSSYSYYSSAEKALENAIQWANASVTEYLDYVFPLRGCVLEKSLEKKDKMKQVYINLGTNWNVHEDQRFGVYVVGSVAGRETKREIGRLKVEEVLGFDISLCKVSKGGKEIKNAMDSGAMVVVQSE